MATILNFALDFLKMLSDCQDLLLHFYFKFHEICQAVCERQCTQAFLPN